MEVVKSAEIILALASNCCLNKYIFIYYINIIINFKFIYKNERIKVTISSGIATRSANLSETMTLEAADKMLYLSKENGRNQVMPKIIEEK